MTWNIRECQKNHQKSLFLTLKLKTSRFPSQKTSKKPNGDEATVRSTAKVLLTITDGSTCCNSCSTDGSPGFEGSRRSLPGEGFASLEGCRLLPFRSWKGCCADKCRGVFFLWHIGRCTNTWQSSQRVTPASIWKLLFLTWQLLFLTWHL